MTEQENHAGEDHAGGTGPEGTIPDSEDGIAVGTTDEPSNFEAEEDSPSETGDSSR